MNLLEKLKRIEVIRHGKITLSGGAPSDFYVDIKKAYGNPELLCEIADGVYNLFDKRINCVVAMGHGGIPLGTAISIRNNLNLAIVREFPKKHGPLRVIDGHLLSERDVVALVDDVYTTGGSIRKMREIVDGTKAIVRGEYVVVSRASDNPENLKYLFKLEDLTT